MLCRSLKVLRKPMSRYNISNSRYMRENHYASPCSVYEFLRFSNYKISITLLFIKISQIARCQSIRKFNQFFNTTY